MGELAARVALVALMGFYSWYTFVMWRELKRFNDYCKWADSLTDIEEDVRIRWIMSIGVQEYAEKYFPLIQKGKFDYKADLAKRMEECLTK